MLFHSSDLPEPLKHTAVKTISHAVSQDALIMAGTALGVVLNFILLVQTLRTAHGTVQDGQGMLKPQPT